MEKIKEFFYSLIKKEPPKQEELWRPQLMVSPTPTIHKLKIVRISNNESN